MAPNDSISPSLFARVRFADNPEPRASCLLVVDLEMPSQRLQKCEAAIGGLVSQLQSDDVAARSVELAVMTQTSSTAVVSFSMVEAFTVPNLRTAHGSIVESTIAAAIDTLLARKRALTDAGLQIYRPTIAILADTLPADAIARLVPHIRDLEAARDCFVMFITSDAADIKPLQPLTPHKPLPLLGLQLRDLLPWIG